MRRDAGQVSAAIQQEHTSRLCSAGRCHFVCLRMWSCGGAANPRANSLRTQREPVRPCEAPMGCTPLPVPRGGGAGRVQRGRPRCGTMLDAPSGPLCFFLRAEKEEVAGKPSTGMCTTTHQSKKARHAFPRMSGFRDAEQVATATPHKHTSRLCTAGRCVLLACAWGVAGARLIRAPTD